jgi:hypothetical protein
VSGEAVPAERAISRLRLASRCVRPSRSGRVRLAMTMQLARPGAVQVQIARAVNSRARRSCPPQEARRQRFRRTTTFRRVTTVREAGTQAVTAAVPRRLVLRPRLRPGLYRITVRAHLEGGRLSRAVQRYLRVLG